MIAELSDLTFAWKAGARPVLDIKALHLDEGERTFLWGPSGSGKSTLLGLLAGVIPPQQGEIHVLGYRLGSMSGAARDRFRADHVGVVFQLMSPCPAGSRRGAGSGRSGRRRASRTRRGASWQPWS
jgi:putative ABC transport system ATP-binding protein